MKKAVMKYVEEFKKMFSKNQTDSDSIMERRENSGIEKATLVIRPSIEQIEEYVNAGEIEKIKKCGIFFINEMRQRNEMIREYDFVEYIQILQEIEETIISYEIEIQYFDYIDVEEISDWFDDVSSYLQGIVNLEKIMTKKCQYRSCITDKVKEVYSGLEALEDLCIKWQSCDFYQMKSKEDSFDEKSLEEYIATVMSDIPNDLAERTGYADMDDKSFKNFIAVLDDVINQNNMKLAEGNKYIEYDACNRRGGLLPFGVNTIDELDAAIREEKERQQQEKENRIANASNSISLMKGNGTASTGGFASFFGEKDKTKAKPSDTSEE